MSVSMYQLPDNLTAREYESIIESAFTLLWKRFGAEVAAKAIGKTLLQASGETNTSDTNGGGKKLHAKWHRAVDMLVEYPDPWLSRGIHNHVMEHCVRHRWDPKKQSWRVDDVLVKMEDKPFAAGAMRECYAMKKLSTLYTPSHQNWVRAANCVAKHYKKAVAREAYYKDTRLQMDSKDLGELYNKTDPPKKVDVLQCYVVEFTERPERNIFTVEHLIEGDYVKYNSNSGFVVDENVRNTPQAFSHFSFQVTRGSKLCVDIQGVGDLYTDPQIHTHCGTEYGDGNLGLRGMALFFCTHECNPLCERLKLLPFIRCQADLLCPSSSSASSSSSQQGSTVSNAYRRSAAIQAAAELNRKGSIEPPVGRMGREEQLEMMQSVPLVADIYAVLHYELSKLHAETVAIPELYTTTQVSAARQAGIFHLLRAAAMGLPLALCVMARLFCGVDPSSALMARLLKEMVDLGDLDAPDSDVSFRYAELAAQRGVTSAAAAVAAAYAGSNDWSEVSMVTSAKNRHALAVQWYDAALAHEKGPAECEEEAAALPGGGLKAYEIMAAKAELLLKGGEGLMADPASAATVFYEAAELATSDMRGKLAQSYYERAAVAESM